MGATHVKVGLRSMAGANGSFEADFLVDTDANDCLARASALRGIGIESVVTRAYELADGTTHEYLFGSLPRSRCAMRSLQGECFRT